MTANKNEPDKKPAGSPAAQPGNRPHATIDLKATEVTPPAGAAKAAGDKPVAGKPEVAGASDKAQSAADTTGPFSTAASSSAAAAKGSASSDAAATSAGAPKSAKPTGTPPPPGSATSRPAPRGSGGFFTHLAAGLMGGIIALLAADILASQLGFEATDRPEMAAAVEQRIAALETARGQQRAIPADVAARLAAAEAKLGKLEQLDTNVEGVAKKQGTFEKDLNTLNEQLRAQSTDSGADDRVAKLEEQLRLMSSAGATDQGGRLPQLAAISGKLTDLESTVANQLDALRKNVTQDVDARLASATEAGQTARSGTQRIDRELSTLKAESAEVSTGLTGLKTDSDRISASLKTTQEDLKRLKAEIDTRLATFAKPEDVSSAVAPIGSKLAALEQNVQSVVKSEGDRKTTAERIVLSLELANLKRAIDRGKAYAPELEQARKVAGASVDLAPLDRFALEGVPTSAELQQQFKPIAFKIIDAQEPAAEASIVDRLLAGAKSVVRVRRTNLSADDKSIEAVVARMEAGLNEDRLADVLQEAKSLPPAAQDVAQDFLAKVEARNAVDGALASVETQLKASLAAAPADTNGKAAE